MNGGRCRGEMGVNASALHSEKCQDRMGGADGERSFLQEVTPRLNPEGGRESAGGENGGPSGRYQEYSHTLQVTRLDLKKIVLLLVFSFTPGLEWILCSLPQPMVNEEFHVLTHSFTF